MLKSLIGVSKTNTFLTEVFVLLTHCVIFSEGGAMNLPTFNQLVRSGRQTVEKKSKAPGSR